MVSHSTFSDNVTDSGGSGGGIYIFSGAVTVSRSTFSDNTADFSGGGIFNDATLTVSNSTFSDNVANSVGGGIFNIGTLTVSHSTLSGNAAGLSGGIFNGFDSTLNVKNSIVANSPAGRDCRSFGTLNVAGVNFDTDGSCPGFMQVTSAELNLGPLDDNGGPTQTHALLPDSVAIDAAPDENGFGHCTDYDGNPVTTDQRGVARPQDAACDVGAYEAGDATPPTVTCAVIDSTLFPLNHNLINVGLSAMVSDDQDPNPTVQVFVFGDEDDEDIAGAALHSPDAKAIGLGTLRLRAERNDSGDGRVYLIVVVATDASGNVGFDCCTVTVSYSNSPSARASVTAQAAAAEAWCLANGTPPPGYFVIGDGAVIGPKQ
jgi:hypothetical protein